MPESPIEDHDSRSSIQEPSASAAIVACGTFGLSAKRKSSRRLIVREAGVDQAAALAAFGALGHLGLQQRGEVGDRGLLLAGGFGGERAEAAADGRQLELDRRAPRSAPPAPRSSRWCAVIARLRAAGRSRRDPGAGRSCAAQPRLEVGRAARASRRPSRAAGEHRDGAAVVRAGGQRAADGELDPARARARGRASARRPSAGRPPSARSALDRRPQLVEAVRPGAALALLAQRAASRQRAGLAREQLEVVIELRAGAEPADQALVAGDLAAVVAIVISRAPIRARTRSPTRATGTE